MKTILILMLASLSASAQTNRITFTNQYGETIHGEVVRAEATRIVYKTEDLNLGAVYFTNLPPALQEKYHYDPVAVRAAEKAAADKRNSQREAEFKKAIAALEAAQPKEAPIEGPVDITEGIYKLIDQGKNYWKWSYKVAFRNNTSSECTKFLKLKFIDAGGFELDHELVEVHLDPFETKTVTGVAMVKSEKAALVENVYRSWDN